MKLAVWVSWMYRAFNIFRLLFYLMTLFIKHFKIFPLPFLFDFGLHPTTLHIHIAKTADSAHSGEDIHGRDVTNNDIIKEKPHLNLVPSDPRPTYTWTKSGHTECSTTCGTGEKIRKIQTKITLWKNSASILSKSLCSTSVLRLNKELGHWINVQPHKTLPMQEVLLALGCSLSRFQ